MGDTLARAMEAAGYQVSREYYFNNAGRQMEILGQSLKIRYQQALGQEIALEEDHYQGEYLYWIAMVLVGQHGDDLADEQPEKFSKIAEQTIFASIRATLRRLNTSTRSICTTAAGSGRLLKRSSRRALPTNSMALIGSNQLILAMIRIEYWLNPVASQLTG